MAYTRTTWVKNQTPLSATNLNNIESGIEAIDKIVQNLLDKTYPIGSIYMSVDSTNPGSILGGTWEVWGSGRVPVGVNASDSNFDTVEKTGGVSTVTLTAAQSGVPAHAHGLNSHVHGLNSHTHTLTSNSTGGVMLYNNPGGQITRTQLGTSGSSKKYAFTASGTDYLVYGGAKTGAASGNTAAASGNTANSTAKNATSAHTNLQPYITCYMFKRTA